MYCTNCGKMNEEHAIFCTGCGEPMNSGGQEELPVTPSVERRTFRNGPNNLRKKNLILWGVILLSILVISGFTLILLRPGNNAEEEKLTIPKELFHIGKNQDEGTADTATGATVEAPVTIGEDSVFGEEGTTGSVGTDAVAAATEDSTGTTFTEGAGIDPAVQEDTASEDTYQYGEPVELSRDESELVAALVKAAYGSGNYDAAISTDESKMNFLWELAYRSDIELITTEEINGEYGYISGEFLSDLLYWGLGQRLELNRLEDYDHIVSPFSHTFQEGYIHMSGADGARYPKLIIDSIQHTEKDQICVSGKGYIGEDFGNHDLVKLEAYLTKEPESIFAGYRLQYMKVVPATYIKPDTVKASSCLEESSVADYIPENVLDDDLSTAWVEGAVGYGIGETITFTWEEEQTLIGIAITNGYCKSEDTYLNNGRMTEFYITFSDGTGRSLAIEDEVKSRGDVSEFYFLDGEVRTDTVCIAILGVTEGYKYEDTCISEIRFLQ
jgi:hypothetical protein